MKICIIGALFFFVFKFQAKSQLLDSLHIEVGTIGTAASRDYLPLWMVANKFGVISDQKFDFSTNFRISSSYRLGEEYNPIYDNQDKGFYFDYSINIYNNNHFGKILIPEAYVKARYKKFKLSIGRFKQIIGEVNPELSSGSLGVSGNATPIPQISLSLDYTDIPFTNGFAQFKGQFSHGWMGKNQFLKNAFLHEKNLYIRIGRNKLKLYGGVQHYAVWAGTSKRFPKLDRSLKAYLNVVLAREANDGTVPDDILPNRVGDHRGVIEAGAEWENDIVKISLNNQTPFETGQGIDIRNIDKLVSLNITNKTEDAVVRSLVLEFIYTKQMNNFYDPQYRESYYNNGVYATGWEYNDNIIGTPLFINRVRGARYFNNILPYDWGGDPSKVEGLTNIINNRIIGGHIGMKFRLQDNLLVQTMLTITGNYGNSDVGNFFPSKVQGYTFQQVEHRLNNKYLSLTGGLGYDFGQLSNDIGLLFGLKYNFYRD